MHRATAYAALAAQLDQLRQFPLHELVARIGQPSMTHRSPTGEEDLTLSFSVCWANEKHSAVRIDGVALGSSHWRLERVEERVVVQLPKVGT